MSRIGKKPVEIPAGVTVTINGHEVVVKGPKGELKQEIRREIEPKIEDGKVIFEEKIKSKQSSAYWGLSRALVANMIKGVTDGFEKKLELLGVGFRVKKESDKKISMTLGFSHPVIFDAPEGIVLDTIEQTGIVVSGIDRQLVGLTAARIRKLKKPEPYKGKGIKYENEVVRRKAGKAGKV